MTRRQDGEKEIPGYFSYLSKIPHAVGNVPQGCAAPSHPSGMRSVLSSSSGKKAFSFAEHS